VRGKQKKGEKRGGGGGAGGREGGDDKKRVNPKRSAEGAEKRGPSGKSEKKCDESKRD